MGLASTSRPGEGRPRNLAAALAVACAALLGGCSASTIADHIPTAVGGLPEDAPKRPAIQAAYPAVHDRPPVRGSATLTADEQRQLEADLAAARERVGAAAKPAAGSARNP